MFFTVSFYTLLNSEEVYGKGITTKFSKTFVSRVLGKRRTFRTELKATGRTRLVPVLIAESSVGLLLKLLFKKSVFLHTGCLSAFSNLGDDDCKSNVRNKMNFTVLLGLSNTIRHMSNLKGELKQSKFKLVHSKIPQIL